MDKKNSRTSFNFVDLFCGCGGLSYGLEMAGHKCLLGVDHDQAALKSFAYNHKNAETYHGDIRLLKGSLLKKLVKGTKIDMVVGGPPCQGFSTVGKGHAHDERNFLFREFVRVVKELNPKVIIFENVTGMVAKKNAHILESVFRYFEKLGYQMEARVLAAEEYGVPECRRRTIIMGVKGGECVYPNLTHGLRGKKTLVTVKDALMNLRAGDGKIYNHDKNQAVIANKEDRERLKFIPAGKGVRYHDDEKAYLPKKLWYKVDWKKLPEERFRQTRLQRLPWSKPSPTILTSRTSYYHPKEARYLTPREAAACQSFPNDFIFYGSVTAQFRQIGNAVPPLLAYALGESIKKIKFSKKTKSKVVFHENVVSTAFNYGRSPLSA